MRNNQPIIFLCCICLSISSAVFSIPPSSQTQHVSSSLVSSAIIEVYDKEIFQGIILVEQKETPFNKKIPGGKVECGETVEYALTKEIMNEIGLSLHDLKQFHVYLDQTKNFQTYGVEIAHIAKVFQKPQSRSGNMKVCIVNLESIPWNELASEHTQILKDYILWKKGGDTLTTLLMSQSL